MRTAYQPDTRQHSRSVANTHRTRGIGFPAVSASWRYPLQMRNGSVVQRAVIKTGTDVDPGGTKSYNVPELDILNALYKKVTGFAKQDYPLAPRIERDSNANRFNRAPENEIGEDRTLGKNPITDLWQLVIDFKKSRSMGAVNIKSNDGEGFASAIYNQYGPTQPKPENTDVMIYKHPKRSDKKKDMASDKGVSYTLAATKFAELRDALTWDDPAIATALLQYYQDGVVPEAVSDKGQRRNFGYLATLMTIPESVRSIGTFPLGLIQLDNIKTGAETANGAFTADPAKVIEVAERKAGRTAEKKRQEEERKAIAEAKKKEKEAITGKAEGTKETPKKAPRKVLKVATEEIPKEASTPLAPVYKDGIDLGGTYAPAYSGSKKYLNKMEADSDKGALSLSGNEKEEGYYWDVTLNRYTDMIKKFLQNHPELLSIGEKVNERGKATELLIGKILTHLGIGEGITGATTPGREVARVRNQALFGLNTTDVHDPVWNKDFFTRQHRNVTRLQQSVEKYPIAPSSPTAEYNQLLELQNEDFFDAREERKEDAGEFERAYGIDDPRKQIEQMKAGRRDKTASKEVVKAVELDKKRRRDEKPTEEPKEEVKRLKFDPREIKKGRLANRINDIILNIALAYQGEELSKAVVMESLQKSPALAEIYKQATSDTDLRLSVEDINAMVDEALRPFER